MPTVVPKKSSSALSMEDLDKQYNPNIVIPEKIKKALARLGDHAMTSVHFQREANVSVAHLAQFAEFFEEHQVVIRENGKPKTLWCGTPAFARQVRERLGV